MLMPRPCRCRKIAHLVSWNRFIPQSGAENISEAGEVVLTHDELEAIRLADLGGLYQEDAAKFMNVSRQTFARIVEAARRKVAEALCEGKTIRVEGGAVEVCPMRKFCCAKCGHGWEVPHGSGRPAGCPACGSASFHRSPEDRGYARNGPRCRRGNREGCGRPGGGRGRAGFSAGDPAER